MSTKKYGRKNTTSYLRFNLENHRHTTRRRPVAGSPGGAGYFGTARYVPTTPAQAAGERSSDIPPTHQEEQPQQQAEPGPARSQRSAADQTYHRQANTPDAAATTRGRRPRNRRTYRQPGATPTADPSAYQKPKKTPLTRQNITTYLTTPTRTHLPPRPTPGPRNCSTAEGAAEAPRHTATGSRQAGDRGSRKTSPRDQAEPTTTARNTAPETRGTPAKAHTPGNPYRHYQAAGSQPPTTTEANHQNPTTSAPEHPHHPSEPTTQPYTPALPPTPSHTTTSPQTPIEPRIKQPEAQPLHRGRTARGTNKPRPPRGNPTPSSSAGTYRPNGPQPPQPGNAQAPLGHQSNRTEATDQSRRGKTAALATRATKVEATEAKILDIQKSPHPQNLPGKPTQQLPREHSSIALPLPHKHKFRNHHLHKTTIKT